MTCLVVIVWFVALKLFDGFSTELVNMHMPMPLRLRFRCLLKLLQCAPPTPT